MVETAIVGGGLCGLALAAQLARRGRDFELFEARQRWGGRILSVDCKLSGHAVDLGASWFWPDRQPLLTALLGELGLESFAQFDDGAVLRLNEADATPERIDVAGGVHGGARRVVGGAQKIVEALRRLLPQERLHLDCQIRGIRDGDDHVVLTINEAGATRVVEADRVVLALPPRLAEERIIFAPGLDGSMRQVMRDAPTWMAAQAKAVTTFAAPAWREAGHSGNAFVSHEQAVFDEIFDASDPRGGEAALGGFLAMGPELREAFRDGLPMLMQSQFEQVFGGLPDGREHFYQDWAKDAETCSALDRERGREEQRSAANPLLRRALWQGRLHLGGSETGSIQAGYMEGALEAAQRIARDIFRDTAPEDDAALRQGENANDASLRRFTAWVERKAPGLLDDYRRRLNASLANQARDQLTQRAMLGSVEAFFAQALARVESLPFDVRGVAVEKGRSALTPLAQEPFGGVLKQFFDDVAAFNATSCALSNFPDEHRLAREYVQVIMRDVAAAWTEFSLALNTRFLGEVEAQDGAAA
ncbi:FAD-dependent oxidoreductase [Rhodoblastus acidophilus]|uniref:FAD-dependent oxidoreductase n=1 Tax=Candidatus Rhodoblastus alkanivorans TaxID=2954117 RepID=A0ABS9Z9U2_9HYPH|nr:FAD-dependent oxidoreductase [Candidatus Rhodoblastus alkanivorans]MCI4677107.1 FAD-dependent oxidoreductase [Candidatus Rhodoblastus alkanivorans]MCI4684460.1 FAD-dependent oxidoreductase [Candidatus Rhodoblastus alkanivorans]MDI4641781.1 FAD-dependent oxidoreductase [Rhodoblastus acidophilus]